MFVVCSARPSSSQTVAAGNSGAAQTTVSSPGPALTRIAPSSMKVGSLYCQMFCRYDMHHKLAGSYIVFSEIPVQSLMSGII